MHDNDQLRIPVIYSCINCGFKKKNRFAIRVTIDVIDFTRSAKKCVRQSCLTPNETPASLQNVIILWFINSNEKKSLNFVSIVMMVFPNDNSSCFTLLFYSNWSIIKLFKSRYGHVVASQRHLPTSFTLSTSLLRMLDLNMDGVKEFAMKFCRWWSLPNNLYLIFVHITLIGIMIAIEDWACIKTLKKYQK